MNNKDLNTHPRRLILSSIAVAMLGYSATVSASQVAPKMSQAESAPIFLAETEGMERRQDRRDDRQDNRGDRRDTRQDCRGDEGVVGKDKRDCKQEGRQERSMDDKG